MRYPTRRYVPEDRFAVMNSAREEACPAAAQERANKQQGRLLPPSSARSRLPDDSVRV